MRAIFHGVNGEVDLGDRPFLLNGANGIIDLLGASHLGRGGVAVLIHGEEKEYCKILLEMTIKSDRGGRQRRVLRLETDRRVDDERRLVWSVWCGGGEGSVWDESSRGEKMKAARQK